MFLWPFPPPLGGARGRYRDLQLKVTQPAAANTRLRTRRRVVIRDSSLGPSGNPWIEVLREFLRVFGIWWYPELGDFDSKRGFTVKVKLVRTVKYSQPLNLGTNGITFLPKHEKIIIPVHQKGSLKNQQNPATDLTRDDKIIHPYKVSTGNVRLELQLLWWMWIRLKQVLIADNVRQWPYAKRQWSN